MLRESRQQKRSSDSWRKTTREGIPTAKSLVQICTSASLSAVWKYTNCHRAGSKTAHLKLNAEFHPTVYVCFLNYYISNTSFLNKFSSPMRCQIKQLHFWSYFCFFVFLGLLLSWNVFSAWFSLFPSSAVTTRTVFFFYSSFFSVWQVCLIFLWLIQCASYCSYCSCFSYFLF